jgi:hypothetical protein
LQSILTNINSARFALECLRGGWLRMDDDEIAPLIDDLRESHDELTEIFNGLKEESEADSDEAAA